MAYHIFVEGGLGQGKTFIMSVLAHHWRERVRLNGGELKLFSNYGLEDSYPMSHYTDWYEVAKAQGSICCWDEAHMAFSNRKWSRFGSTLATEVMMYTRKMQSVQIYCSPSIKNVDSRIRDIVEVLIQVRRLPNNKGFSYRMIDYQTGEFRNKHFLPMFKAKQIFKLGLYDTHQMVQGFPLPSTEPQGEKFFQTLEEIHNESRRKKVIA